MPARQIVHGPDPVPSATAEHLTSVLWHRARQPEGDAARAAVRFRDREGRWDELGWRELGPWVRDVAAGLVERGVERGTPVAIMAPTRIEWAVADLAVLSVGAVTVPVYETSSAELCGWVLGDSGARLVLVAGEEERRTVVEACDHHGAVVDEIVTFDDGGLDRLAGGATAASRDEVEERLAALTGADDATIVYTSGTTGRPKGCVLTHGGVLWTVRQARAALGSAIGPDDATLLFLPLAHVFARFVQFAALDAGAQVAYSHGMDHLAEDLREVSPTFLVVVPRVLEKVHARARHQAVGLRRRVFDLAEATSRSWSRARWLRHPLALARLAFEPLVYRKLRDAVGGRIRTCISGGSSLDPDLAHFFRGAGITVLEGYGLTETTAPATLNTPDRLRIGTVGRPLPGVRVGLTDDGEVLVAGRNVFQRYHGNAEATDEAFEGEWFRTGDLGELHDGFLTITGRAKEIIVTRGGENVPTRVLEEQIERHPLVSQAMVVGEDRPFVGALVSLDPDELADRELEVEDPGQLDSTPAIRGEVQRAVDRANQHASRPQSVREYVILPRELTEADGELTPTLKLKRQAVADHFRDQIEAIYAEREG